MNKFTYSTAILDAYNFLLKNYPEVFVIGQGLWSPWYVGKSMDGLDKKYSVNRIIDTPVSESVCTGAAVGASLFGSRPIVVHPRMDFMLYCMDSIINEAAKWSYMFAGQSCPCVTIRAIINRGGEQGAQHSQSLHSLFSHIPGLRVVMPSTAQDARDLLIYSVLCDDPVLYIDDRWLYEREEYLLPVSIKSLYDICPKVLNKGKDITVVGCGFSTSIALSVASLFAKKGIFIEVIDLRILNPINMNTVINSVNKTRRLIVIDIAWKSCSISSEVVATVCESISLDTLLSNPVRINLPDCPAPSSSKLEKSYYNQEYLLKRKIEEIFDIK